MDEFDRHRIMPGHVECCTRPVLAWIGEHISVAPVNIMDQDHPRHLLRAAQPAL